MGKFVFIYRGNTKGGTHRVNERLLHEFDKDTINEWLLLTDKEELQGKFKNIKVKYISGNFLLWDYIYSVLYLLKHKYDTIFYPKGSIPFTHLLVKAKKVYMVHDLGYFEKELNAYPIMDTLYMKIMIPFSCRVANTVLAISNFTKKDIATRFKIDEEKIKVAYEGVEDKFQKITESKRIEDCLKRNKVTKPYIFYSGSISPRKNLLRVLKSFDQIKDQFPHTLVMTGRASWGNTGIDEYIQKNLKDRVNIVGFVSEEDLVTLYSEADLYVFPSLYEGFGLPILEAQACGCPVLTSDVSSCPEVAGDSAVVINPYNEEEIADGIKRVLEDSKYREKLIEKGYENIKRFGWERMAKEIISNL